ncbi:MAG: winged helix-turn-helix transcriptional regulator [Candidatus Methanomethylophilaceae archaeon]|nr:winged helix-turn-helix transcriptional regulator [Candidatus Methanomethylophilaceae archaeon]
MTDSIDSKYDELAEFFKTIGDPVRLKILFMLKDGELCVHDISNRLDMSMSAVSHQLRLLKDRKFVTSRKDGKHVFYSLMDSHIHGIIEMSYSHMVEQ